MPTEEELFEIGIRGIYFRRDGTPYSNAMEWAKDFEQGMKLRRVDETLLWWGGRVSTIWLGLNHNFGLNGPPLIFETMVFPPKSTMDLDMERYSNEAQAIAGHQAMVKRWQYSWVNIVRAWIRLGLDYWEYLLIRINGNRR